MLCQTHWELQQEVKDWEASGRHSLHTGGYVRGELWRCLSMCCPAHGRSLPLAKHTYVEQDCPVVARSRAHILAPQKGLNSWLKLLAEDAEKGRFEE